MLVLLTVAWDVKVEDALLLVLLRLLLDTRAGTGDAISMERGRAVPFLAHVLHVGQIIHILPKHLLLAARGVGIVLLHMLLYERGSSFRTIPRLLQQVLFVSVLDGHVGLLHLGRLREEYLLST